MNMISEPKYGELMRSIITVFLDNLHFKSMHYLHPFC